MKVLITGGTGLIGRALIDELLLDSHQIFVLTRNPEKAKLTLPNEVHALQWDGHSPTGWGNHIEECDTIINLAGESIAGVCL